MLDDLTRNDRPGVLGGLRQHKGAGDIDVPKHPHALQF
jgi:hypothetical protein